jgi:hypothetical protein
LPAICGFAPDEECGFDLLMAVAKNVGLDDETATDHAFSGKATAVDFWRYRFDRDAVGREPNNSALSLFFFPALVAQAITS